MNIMMYKKQSSNPFKAVLRKTYVPVKIYMYLQFTVYNITLFRSSINTTLSVTIITHSRRSHIAYRTKYLPYCSIEHQPLPCDPLSWDGSNLEQSSSNLARQFQPENTM